MIEMDLICALTPFLLDVDTPHSLRGEGGGCLRWVIIQLERNTWPTSKHGNDGCVFFEVSLCIVWKYWSHCCLSTQLINICSSDGQRLYEAVSMSCLLAGGPLVGILGLSYTAYFLGPAALLGSAVFVLFYPTMVRLQPKHLQPWDREPFEPVGQRCCYN